MSTHDQYIKYVLGELRNKESLNTDNFIPFEVVNKSNLVESGNNAYILNADEQFNIERNESKKYRINGKLKFLTDNLFSGAFGTQPNSIDFNPITEENNLLDVNGINKNWLIQITYPSEQSEDFNLKINGVSTSVSEGLQIENFLPEPELNRTIIRTKQKHNLTPGEYVYVNIINLIGSTQIQTFYETYQGYHRVVSLDPQNMENGFVIDTQFIQDQVVVGNIKRVLNASKNDVTFDYTKNIEQIQRSNEFGTTTGTTLNYTKIFSPNHGLVEGNFIDLRFNLANRINGTREVIKVIDEDNFLIKFNLNLIGVTQLNPQLILLPLELKFRRTNAIPSKYYVRKFEVITELKDYRCYRGGFETSIFTDGYVNDTYLFHFDTDIDTSNLRDNLGRPLTELFLTITKRSSGDLSEFGGWSNVINMWESDKQVIGNNFDNDGTDFNIETLSYWNNPTNIGQSGTIQRPNIGDKFIGDIVEYNRLELIEHVVHKTIFRFTPNNVINNTTYITDSEGYYYYPHNRIELNKFSDIIRIEKNSDNVLVPDYVQINNDGTVVWRDILPIGFFELGVNGVDYPFVNGCHYIYDNHDIYLRRQLPVGVENYERITFVVPKESDLDGEVC
jgi:hypothetical protein